MPPMSDPAQIAAMRPAMEKMQLGMPYQTTVDRTSVSEDTVDISFRDGTSLPAAFYKPSVQPASTGPLVALYHGEDSSLAFLAKKSLLRAYNTVVVSVNYRLAPEHKFPRFIHDSWDALNWASTLGADPFKGFIVGGSSAGGNIAAVMFHLARDQKLSPPITGLSFVYPVVASQDAVPKELAHECTAHTQNANAPGMLNAETLAFMRKCYNPATSSGLYSVLNWETGQQDLPKFDVLVCGLDQLRDAGLLYVRELQKAGVGVKLDVYPGVPHSFDVIFPPMNQAEDLRKDRGEAFAWMLEGQ
ncbi:hypothetical protein AC579_7099 [Pseudocercospora musae]|uniref:Alpha/beta hydrolase fold-3 domain-containing protein n=1 Tax=Pseudocercospora musae TaxID=113226 RepID=A0A139IML8_9PEZI|nr:hypothetical protein AC579_7099 [Pseudocercospora musae]